MTHFLRLATGLFLLFNLADTARADWWQASTDHFIVYSESNEADARKFAADLDRFDAALRIQQGMPVEGDVGRANKVTIYRFGEPADIGQLAGGGSVYGFYIPRAGGSVAFSPAKDEVQRGSRHFESKLGQLDRTTVLKHEYTHHFMLKNFPTTYPGWFVEGYAELMAMIELRDDGSFFLGNAPEHRSYELFRLQMVPLETYLDNTRRLRNDQYINYYGQGWLLTHYLYFSKDRAGQLDAFLTAVRKGEQSLVAAKRVFGDLKQLDREMRSYLNQKRPGAVFKPASYTPPRVEMRRLAIDEVRLMRSRIRLARGVTPKEAESILANLRSLGSWIETSLEAQLLIAEAALDSEKHGEALAAADKAIALDASSTSALVFKARALYEADETAGPLPKDRFASARALLAKARRLDPLNPEPLIRYFETFSKSGETLTEQGRLALESAFPQAAHDNEYRLKLARFLLSADRLAEARTVLLPIAFSAHSGDPEKNPLTKVAQQLDAGDLAGAKAAMAEYDKKEEEEKAKRKK
jgi:tetratricopeptide (TPR) repeat protein